MNRNVWKQPMTVIQKFVANEYVAACHDWNTVYKFTCDAGDGKSGTVYLETNGRPGLQTGWNGDRYLSRYHACGIQHEADKDDEFLDGYYVTTEGWGQQKVTPVIVWRGPNNDNTHCTTNLDKDSWETAKS